ncbi:MAG: hypothetical protein JJV98_13550 [Desulfosarcina sp.]|nr:hypothetical protein [Desulfobacterales bacterium]
MTILASLPRHPTVVLLASAVHASPLALRPLRFSIVTGIPCPFGATVKFPLSPIPPAIHPVGVILARRVSSINLTIPGSFRLPVVSAFSAVPATVQSVLNAITLAIQAFINSIAFRIQALINPVTSIFKALAGSVISQGGRPH